MTEKIIKFGELKVGDVILDSAGNETTVVKAYDVHIPEKMYEIEMDNGEKIKASGNHLWYIEHHTDYSSHRTRTKQAKSMLKDLPNEVILGLEKIATMEDPFEVTLPEVMEIIDFIDDEKAHVISRRILKSIGHIVEESTVYQDPATGDEIQGQMEKVYDGRRVAQQLLSLTGSKNYIKKWPVLIGQVVTTDEIALYYADTELPVIKLL